MENLPADYFTTSSAYTPHVFRDLYPAIDPANDALSQANKVIIVTGASAGIGARGIAPAFAKAAPKAIVLVARNQAKLDVVTQKLRDQHPKVEFVPIAMSVNDEAEVSDLYQVIKHKFGHADVLINNAGSMAQPSTIDGADPQKWWLDFEVNVKGAFLMSQGFLKLLGSSHQGTVITLNTGIAAMTAPSMSSYSISKNASLRLSEYIAAEYSNVTAICMQPGVVKTDMLADSFKKFALDTPELVGGTAVWLSTEAARFLTGRFISANWNVEDLVKQKDKIVAGNDLKVVYQGIFGLDQFGEDAKS